MTQTTLMAAYARQTAAKRQEQAAMTVTAVIALFVFFVCIAALAVLWAGGIADEPPATAAERKCPLGRADVVEDDGDVVP
jgi:hypothetical protein